jgi:4-amino-4-deoxy-L-arabinose transferase-like glycosyltransferase
MKETRLSWTLIFILGLAFALRVVRLETQSLWYDEGYSAYLGAHLPLGQALDLTARDVVPPLYYLLLRGWLPLSGTSEYALRFPSALMGVLAVAVMARIGRRLGGERAGLLSATLAAIAPVLIWLSRDARMYGPLITWSLLATWGLLRAVAPAATSKSRRRGWALFVVAGLAALYSHTVAAFWLLGQVLFGLSAVLWDAWERRERLREALVALGLMAAGYLPWVIVALTSYRTNTGYWPGHLPPPHLWRTAWESFVGGQHLPPAQTGVAAAWFAAATLLGGAILLFKRPRVAAYLLCYLIIPLLAMGVAFQNTPKLAPRYPTAMAPALLFTLAAAAYATRNTNYVLRITYYVFLAGVILLSLRADANLYFNPDYGKDDWRAAAKYVQSHRAPGEAVILISGHAFPVFAYYYGWEGWHALPDDVQLDVTHVLNYPAVAPQLNQILAGASGVWLVLWQDEVVDPTGLLPALLGDVGRELPAIAFQGSTAGDRVELRHFEFDAAARFSDELPIQHPLRQTVAPGLTALGYTLPAEPLPADGEISLRAFWQAEEPLRGAHAASLRLFDRLGQEWARRDGPLAGPYFSERWPTSTPVMGQYTVTLPLGTPPGTYIPTLMLYWGDEVFEMLRLPPLVITRPVDIPSPAALGLSPSADRRPPGAGDELALVGVGFDQGTVTPCQNWFLSLAWRAETHPSQDYVLRLSAGRDHIVSPLAVNYPTSYWQRGDVWRTRHRIPINCHALDGTVPVTAQLLSVAGQPAGDPFALGEVTVVAGRRFTLPASLTTMNVQLRPRPDEGLDDGGALAGYWLERARVPPGENLRVTLYWRAGQETNHNYSVFVHLQSEGRVWAQHDSWPATGLKPTSTWAQGEIIADEHVVPVGTSVPPGSYQLVVGMYDAETLQPLAAFAPDGQPVAGGRIVLQPVTVYLP